MTTQTNGQFPRATRPEADPLTSLEREVLEACREVVLRQRELAPLLAAALGVAEREIFHTWALRHCAQRGKLEGTEWVYFFHGLECDLKNSADGRFLRIDFGPGGSLDTFTAWGVLQFIMTAHSPWPEFAALKSYFAAVPPPFDQFSGSLSKMSPVWDALEGKGIFVKADQILLDFQAKHTTVAPDGHHHIQFPPGTTDEIAIDCSVANRNRISQYGHSLLASLKATPAT